MIHAVPQLTRKLDQSLEAARAALIVYCRAYRSHRGDLQRVYVIFDGAQEDHHVQGEQIGGVSVVFTSRHEEADARILSLIKTDRGAHKFVVVSNDTELLNNARAHGARAMSVAEFYAPRPVAGIKGRRAPADDKPGLSAVQAKRLTDEYRQHLERRSRQGR